MQRAAFKDTVPASRRQSVLYRDGLMLALRPLRLGDFIRLNPRAPSPVAGRELVDPIPEAETKTRRRSIDEPFPDCLVEPLDTYLREFRPALIAHRHGRRDVPTSQPWAARGGRPLPERTVQARIAFKVASGSRTTRICSGTRRRPPMRWQPRNRCVMRPLRWAMPISGPRRRLHVVVDPVRAAPLKKANARSWASKTISWLSRG
jgi:hypothetical protein